MRQLFAFVTAAFILLQPMVLVAHGLNRSGINKSVSTPSSLINKQIRNNTGTRGNKFVEAAAPFVSSTLVINEIDYDQVNTDTAEFLELKNVSGGAINLDNYTVEWVNGNSGGAVLYGTTVDLPNVNLAAGDYYVICGNAANVPNCDLDHTPDTDLIQNGSPDAVGLRLSGTLIDAVSYEGNSGAPYTETTGVPNVAASSDSNTVAFIGLSRFADGTDTDNNSADLSIRCITPGATNASATTGCTAPPVIPNLTITDVTANETNAGTTIFTFQVNLSAPAGPGGVTFDIATADGTAQDDNPAAEDNDYVGQSLTGQTIAAGNSSFAFNVTVNGDAVVEPTETFFVNVTNVTGAAATDSQGQGSITNDDSPNLSINDVSQNEGNAGTTAFTFTVSLSTTVHTGVTFDICTADGTAQDDTPATEDNDYAANCLTGQTIPNGNDSYQFTVNVNGDATVESNETFFVNVTNVTGASVSDGQGQGTIVNDDVNLTPIHTIQGSGDTSPVTGQSRTTTGIVTLLRTGSNTGGGTANGFFLQDPNADGDPNTSEGIFVFTSSVPTYTAGGTVSVGDEVYVTGTVQEFNGLTEIGTVTNITVIDTGNSLPTAVTLDATILDPTALPTKPQLEKYESMRLLGTSLKSVAPNDSFFDVYTVLSSVPRSMREPGIERSLPVPPDPTSGTPDCCIPIWDENPERIKLDTNGRAGAPNTAYTSNVTFTNVSGPLDFTFSEWRLIPDAAPTASSNMSAVPLPTPLASEFTVAGFNIENFNNNTTQRQKAALGIRDIMRLPDIIGVVEIFNLASLQALRDEINTISPGAAYEAYLIPTPVSGITQNVGYLVNTARVAVDAVTQERTSDTYIDPATGNPDDTHDRPPLVLRARVDPTGANLPVIVVVNHPRSFIDVELVAGAGPTVRAKRKAQAESIAGLLQELQTNNPTSSVIAVGDYNSYQFNSGYDDSIAVMKGSPTADDQIVVDASPDVVNPNFSNLIDSVPADSRYSFIFEGTPQALDHVLVNTIGLARNTRIAIAHMNSDFPDVPASAYESNAGIPERSSDHDAPVAYFSLNTPQPQGSFIISEFRFSGPGSVAVDTSVVNGKLGASVKPKLVVTPSLIGTIQDSDEYIEFYNNTSSDIIVTTTDGSAGWSLVGADGVVRFTIPVGTPIPAHGHYLAANTLGYSLNGYATPDMPYSLDIPDGSGVALFRSANPVNFTLAERLDAAGYTSAGDLYREGAGFPLGGNEITGNLEYCFFRKMTRATGGFPKDTGDNAADFLGVEPSGTATGQGQFIGAPGPENLSSPINRTSSFSQTLLDPGVSGSTPPNRVRDAAVVTNGQFGTMSVRRVFTNNTGAPVSRLRFRIVEITTFTAPAVAGQADLRALTSIDSIEGTSAGPKPVSGLTLEEPPTQPMGGGWNSSLRAGSITLDTPLAAGESIAVNFLLGVQTPGTFAFFINIEATTDPITPP